jgi:hypothetical protein
MFSLGLVPGYTIRDLGFSIQPVHYPQNTEGSQYEHFYDPWLTSNQTMLAYRPKLCSRCHRMQPAKLEQGSDSADSSGGVLHSEGC